MNLRVVRHEADEEKGTYKVVLKNDGATGILPNSLVEVELRMKAKNEELLEKFKRGFQISMELKECLK
jgi:hypothetical protein